MNKIYTCYERRGLKEAIATEKTISKETFIRLIQSGIYRFYAYDYRIKANRYIIHDIEHNIGLPTWINDYELIETNKIKEARK